MDARYDQMSPGLREALRARKLPQRKPSDADRPPVRALPGKRIQPVPGQLDLDGKVQDEDRAA